MTVLLSLLQQAALLTKDASSLRNMKNEQPQLN